jgi:hypothetical protein
MSDEGNPLDPSGQGMDNSTLYIGGALFVLMMVWLIWLHNAGKAFAKPPPQPPAQEAPAQPAE